MPFTIRVVRQPATAVLDVSGELDLAAAVTLRSAITRTLDEGMLHLRLKLGALTFVDAAGLQSLARARAEALVRGGDLEVIEWGWALDRVVVGATARTLVGGAPSVDA